MPGGIDPARLKARRAHCGLSQADLARRIGRSIQLIKSVETGRSGVSVEVLTAMAGALNCEPGLLVRPLNPPEVDPAVDRWVDKMLANAPEHLPEEVARRVSAALFSRAGRP